MKVLARFAVVAVVLATTSTPAVAATPGTSLADQLEHRVTVQQVLRHLRALQRTARTADGSRAVGTPGFARSADYVVGQLQHAGYRVTRQAVPYTDTAYDAETVRQLAPVRRSVDTLMMQFSPSTPAGGVTAELVAAPTERDGVPVPDPGCTPASYDGLDLTGKIVLVPRSTCGFDQVQQVAADLGARVLLMYLVTPSPQDNWRLHIFEPESTRLPAATIPQAQATALAAATRNGPVTLAVDLRAHVVHGTTENILAEIGDDPDHVVMAGAHLDSVAEGPGIDDNASSAATLLEIARQLSPLRSRLKTTVRFAFWGAEELVDVGSAHYVAGLTPAQLHAIAFYLNFEMIGAPNWATFVLHVADGGPSEKRIETAFTGYFARRGLPSKAQDSATVGSDDFEFAAAGVPVGGLNGAEFAAKTQADQVLFGGQAGQLYDHCYHQPCDTLDNVNRVALARHSRAIAWVIGDLAAGS